MRRKVVCIDFDGTIHLYTKGWYDSSIYDPPTKGAREALRKLVANGYKVIIFTTRLNPEVNEDVNLEKNKISKWFAENGFEKGKHYHDITAIKPIADAYIDDKAIRFTNWEDTLKHLL
jgi:trehalose-6-phosphatase